jgi:hypothetical protein
MSESSGSPACGCKFVEDCDGFECFPTKRACDCACGVLDPGSPECRCPDADDCKPPKVLDEECNCECPPCIEVTEPGPLDGGCEEYAGLGCNDSDATPGADDALEGTPFFGTDPGRCYVLDCFGDAQDVGPRAPVCPEGAELSEDGECIKPSAKVPNPETCECECPECPGDKVANEEDCFCECPPPRVPGDGDDCVCPNCLEPKVPDANCNCVCPGDLSPCPAGKFRALSNCQCYCPPGFYELDGECVECDETCDPPPPCYPIPLPPVGDPILCPDGSQRGVVFYTFNQSSCSWSPNQLIFRVCPQDGSSDSDGSFPSSSSGDDCDCDGAIGEAGTFEIDFVCGFPVVTRQGAGMNFGPGGCSASYTIYEWCDECNESGFPTLRSVQTFVFNTVSCDFDGGPAVDLPCPESESSESSAPAPGGSGSSSDYNSSEGDNPLP